MALMDAVSVVAEFCYQPTVGRFGLFLWDWTPFPVVKVEMSESGIRIPSIDRKVGRVTLFSTSWTAKYKEIELAERFPTPRWLPPWTLSDPGVPFGVRLQMGESRARIVLFSRQSVELVDALHSHQVPIAPRLTKPSFLFIGRR